MLELEGLETLLVDAADECIPSSVTPSPATCSVDAGLAAAEELGTALGWTCALSALMMSAA